MSAAFTYISYRVEALDKEQTIAKLRRFEEIDKYRSFYKILPAVITNSTEHERELVSEILNTGCRELISLLRSERKPHKASIKKVINDCMKNVALAPVSTTNKDFGYELCWYLSDIAGLNMRTSSAANPWGYWDIIQNEVKVIQSRNISPPRKKKPAANRSKTSDHH